MVEWEKVESFNAHGSVNINYVGKANGYDYFMTYMRVSPANTVTDYESTIYMISKEDYESNDCHNIDCFTNSDTSKNIFDEPTFLRYIHDGSINGDQKGYCCWGYETRPE